MDGLDGEGAGAGAVDTIVARATPPGRGAVALLRLSGPGVGGILRALGAERVLAAPPRTAVLTPLLWPEGEGALLDRGLVTRFEGPASYTGEDVAELGVHGGPIVVARILEACRVAGARLAEPGEFTRRAWLNGRLDRLQVEAVEDLVQADSPALHAVAVHQVEGGLSRRLAELREAILGLQVLLAHHLDFPDEDEPPTPTPLLVERVRGVEEGVRLLLATAPGGRLLREGAPVVLAGAPNAGKSSLFNALVGEARALVTDEAGTTRDAVDARVAIRGFPFQLVDTAGLRRDAGKVEALGIEVARRWIASARVVAWCASSAAPPPSEEMWAAMEALVGEGGGLLLPVRTFQDLAEGRDPSLVEAWSREEEDRRWLPLSVVTGEGLGALQDALVEAAFGTLGGGSDGARPEPGHVVVRERHRAALERARGELRAGAQALEEGVPAEFAATHLGEAAEALEELVGPVASDEVLDRLFASFCIGK